MVESDDRSYAIRLRYELQDPELATQIVNALAQIYISDQLDTMKDASRSASRWLNSRLRDLADQSRTGRPCSRRVRRSQHHLERVLNGNIAELRMHELNMQFMEAENDLAKKIAILTQAQVMLKLPGGSAQ